MAPTRILPPLLGTAATAGVALTSYALWEARQYTLREVTVPLLPAGADPLRVLHLSDVHMTPGQTRKQEWLSGLAGLEPDLVINTGDNLSHRRAVGPVLDAYAGLLDVPGVFVFGSNDYFDPGLRNPVGYLFPDSGRRHTHRPALPWRELRDAFTDSGWLDLSNRRGRLRVKGLDLAFAGVDDPHVRYDRLDDVAGRADPASDARIGVVHAPYLRVLDQWTGQARETSSLSGGETFMASLALALGLADAVRSELGGRDLGTLFVDEGFGTLDDESLEDVMALLDGLQSGGRIVGIVSHVADLRARIPHQLVVAKTPDGSTVDVVRDDALHRTA